MAAAATTNPATSLSNTLLSQIQPQLAAGNQQIAGQQLQNQLTPELYAQQQQYAGQQQANQNAQYGLQGQENLASLQNTQQQVGLTGQEQQAGYANTEAGIGLEQGYGNESYANQQAQYGLQAQGLTDQGQYLGTQEQIAGGQNALTQQGYQLQQGNLNYQLPLAQQAQAGAAGASGATNTVGNHNAQDTLQQQYNLNTGQLGLSEQQSSLSNQLQNAGFTNQAQQLGLSQQGLGLQEQLAGQTNQYQNAQYGLQSQYAGQQLGFEQQQNQQTGAQAQQQYGFGQQGLGLEQQASNQGYQYQQSQAGLQGALGAAQGQSTLAGDIGNQLGLINQTTDPLSILQGMSFSGTGNSGN